MNAGFNIVDNPVENVAYGKQIPDGVYKVMVNNYNRRSPSARGFVLEVENEGVIQQFTCDRPMSTGDTFEWHNVIRASSVSCSSSSRSNRSKPFLEERICLRIFLLSLI